jgi:hypothetical protein
MKEVNIETGLSDMQERAVQLIVSGKTKAEVAQDLNIDRSTLYKWSDKIAFEAYYNLLKKDVQDQSINKLLGLYDKAISAISKGLESDSESIRIKTALWLIERIGGHEISYTDPKEVIRLMCRSGSDFDEVKYKKLLKENDLK